jgi:hypothetical protein
MNSFLKNLAAKNLHKAEVIQPRLASRFEPMPQNNWPNIRHMHGLEREEMNEKSTAKRAPTSQVRDAAKARIMSDPVLPSSKQEPPGHAVSTAFEVAAEPNRYQRSLQLAARRKSPFPSIEQRVPDGPDDIEAGQSAYALADATMPVRLATDESQKEIERPKYKQEPSGEEFEPLTSAEQHGHFSPHEEEKILPEPALIPRAIEKPKIEQMPSLETVHSKSNEYEEKRLEKGIEHKDNVRIAPLEKGRTLISPRMIVAQTAVKKYSQLENGEIKEKTTNPGTKPEVMVTIGRIEVKAMPLATISQRKKEKPPVTSLEDYLKK